MPRRAPVSKRKHGSDWAGCVPAPWLAMDADEKREARAAYLAARDFCGECPVHRDGERVMAYRERVGGRAVFTPWAAARFDPDASVRRLALLSGVDHLRRMAVATPSESGAPRHDAIGGFSSWQLDTMGRGSLVRRRALMGDGPAALQDLVGAVAPLGLAVTADRVTGCVAKGRSNGKRRGLRIGTNEEG